MSAWPVTSKATSIMIVDDHHVLTDALATIFRSQPDLHMHMVGVAETCAAAREQLLRTCPDVLLRPSGPALAAASISPRPSRSSAGIRSRPSSR